MKIFIPLLSLLPFIIVSPSFGQCGEISMIGEFSNWSYDYYMDQDSINPNLYSRFISFGIEADEDQNDTIELKFREDHSWIVNWGNNTFPEGYAYQDGPNIHAPYGSYWVTFDCSTGYYYFQDTCLTLSLIGEFSYWDEDYFMDPDTLDVNLYTTTISFDQEDDMDEDGYISCKFRGDSTWSNNWGGTDFPAGNADFDGLNILAEYGTWEVSFHCQTLEYTFSDVVGIDDHQKKNGEVIISPNPVQEKVSISYHLDTPEYIKIQLFDLGGRNTMEIFNGRQPAGFSQITKNVTGLLPGLYIIRWQSASKVITAKVTVM